MSENETFDFNSPLPPMEEYVLLPEGDAEFEVLKLERAYKNMGKLGTVNVAVMTLLVTSLVDNDASAKSIEALLPLSPKVAFKLYQFFAAIGQYEHGDESTFKPDWSKVIGSTGLCIVTHREWTGKDGSTRKSEQIDTYLDSKGRARASDKPRAVGADAEAAESFDEVPF